MGNHMSYGNGDFPTFTLVEALHPSELAKSTTLDLVSSEGCKAE